RGEAREEPGGIGQMLDHLEADDELEAFLQLRQPRDVEYPELERGTTVVLRRDPDRLGAIDGEHAARHLRKEGGAVAFAAAHVEHRPSRRVRGREAIRRQVPFAIDGELGLDGGQALAREERRAHEWLPSRRPRASLAKARTPASGSSARWVSAGRATSSCSVPSDHMAARR